MHDDVDVQPIDDLTAYAERIDDPFLRWSVAADQVVLARRADTSYAVLGHRPRHSGTEMWLQLIGDRPGIVALVSELDGALPVEPAGSTVSAAAVDLVPERWVHRMRGCWDYMATAAPPPSHLPERWLAAAVVGRVDDMQAVQDLLDAGNADAHARPGDADIDRWLGAWSDGSLVAAGALAVTPNGGGHLRAITTHPEVRGRGYGAAVSAELTRQALRDFAPEATLGVYTDNIGAIRLYRRLGYRHVHSFVSSYAAC